ncbi:Uncharacterised protein [Vibrio cholerae]|nr:Uncharacterised protein [Vibrio cholerae]
MKTCCRAKVSKVSPASRVCSLWKGALPECWRIESGLDSPSMAMLPR